MDAMLRVLTASDPAGRADGVRALLKLLVWGQLSDRSVRELARSNLALLARKIVERAGEAGEHYITATRSEYWSMVRAAAGGGLLTVGTALFKLKLGAAHLGPFMTGALSGLNYSVSFILLQTFGLALATKQPAMTAATLARIIGEAHGDGWSHQQLEQLTAHVARTVRTQLAAAVSNVLSVCMGGAGLAVLWRTLWGGPLVAPAKAQASIASLHPLLTGTVFYAALTGVVLWLSSLVAGWVDNWSVCRRLPQAIAEHRWGERWGRARMERVAQLFQRNVAGWGGSISLGLMLAFTPELGAFFSLPLEVRHVTLSTGTLAIGAASLWPTQLLWRGVLFGGVGIATIFVMNLSVSFGLALLLALRARDVGVRESLAVLRRIFFRFLRHPGQFLLPPSARAAEGSLPT
jgi:site-specific recombinase